jgi:hypothetical protein
MNNFKLWRVLGLSLMGLPVTWLAACAAVNGLRPGLAEAQALSQLGSPSARYALGEGRTRLEYRSGPQGRDTWMVDLDARGLVERWHNALEEPRLHALQARAAQQPALQRDELLRTLGQPGERRQVPWMGGGELWSWRFPTNECQLFQVTLNTDGSVRDAGFNIDPSCDTRERSGKGF